MNRKVDLPTLSLRDRAKDERRMRIIKAAHKLIAEGKGGNFSMQELAARADLSPATPYNLFGTKAAILQEVFRLETDGFRRHYATLRAKPPAERVIGTVDRIFSAYVRKPGFYRSLSKNISALGPGEFETVFPPLMDAMFRPLVDDLIADGAIPVSVSSAVISTQLARIFGATFLYYAAQDWDERHFRDQLHIGFALTFLGLFRAKDRAALLPFVETGPE